MAGVARAAPALRTLVVSGTNGAHAGAVIEPATGGGALVDGTPQPATLTHLAPPRARLATPAATHEVLILPLPDARRAAVGVQRVEVVIDGWRFEVDVEPEARARLRERATRARGELGRGGPLELRAIIPGRVLSVDVAEGDAVEAGQRVLVLEAMKMQNELRSPRTGTIGRLAVGAGQTVELGDVLLVVE
jgi:biotin carboxyl carrier protein